MTSQQLILDHDRWRKGTGGAPAGPPGGSDSFSYAGLDLDLVQFTGWAFTGTRFSNTTFREGQWTSCRFVGSSFTGCDLESIAATDCEFVECIIEATQVKRGQLRRCTFQQCQWLDVNLDNCRWEDVHLLNCTGTLIEGRNLHGLRTKWTGSRISQMKLHNAKLIGNSGWPLATLSKPPGVSPPALPPPAHPIQSTFPPPESPRSDCPRR